MASTGLGLAARPTTEGGPRCFDGVERVRLASTAALLAIRSVDLYDVYAHPLEVPGQTRSIGAGSFDADLGDAAEVLEPRHQGLVAGGIGRETLGAEQPTERVQCGCHMDVAMGVDTTGDPASQLLRWSWSSLSLKVGGMARPFRIGATGGLGCSSNPDQSPHLGDGTCRLSMCGWKVSVDDVFQRHGTPSQAEPASTPEAIQDQQSSGGP